MRGVRHASESETLWLPQGSESAGQIPDFYELIRAAHYMNVPPWELAGMPETAEAYCWIPWATMVEDADRILTAPQGV